MLVFIVFSNLNKLTESPRNDVVYMIFIMDYTHKAHMSMLGLPGLLGL
jgi:hypothetical protein